MLTQERYDRKLEKLIRDQEGVIDEADTLLDSFGGSIKYCFLGERFLVRLTNLQLRAVVEKYCFGNSGLEIKYPLTGEDISN